jgi:hypothetical protein|tara:strand:- start:1767 stop:1934 length:168 start_codon:yes stop_codon:yes gene_type:complete
MKWWTSLKSFFSKKENVSTHKSEYKKVRARTKKGRFVADDPNTPDVNEAYVKVKK